MTDKRSITDRAREMRQRGFTIRETAKVTGLTFSQVRQQTSSAYLRKQDKHQLEQEKEKLLAERPDDPAWVTLVEANF